MINSEINKVEEIIKRANREAIRRESCRGKYGHDAYITMFNPKSIKEYAKEIIEELKVVVK